MMAVRKSLTLLQQLSGLVKSYIKIIVLQGIRL